MPADLEISASKSLAEPIAAGINKRKTISGWEGPYPATFIVDDIQGTLRTA